VAYVQARVALGELASVDEAKQWADKAAALKAWAYMAKHDELRLLALRVQAHAERRMGQLLKELPDGTGAGLRVINNSTGTGTVDNVRQKVADQAGLSRRQVYTAQRVASVPAEKFDELVDSPTPPSVTALAELGTVKRDPLSVEDYIPQPPAATFQGTFTPPERLQWAQRLRELADFCKRTSVETCLSTPYDPKEVMADAETVATWATDLYTQLSFS
jgi:hypothetical protein